MENTEQNNHNEFESTENTGHQQHMNVLPKPILEQDTKNWVRKSIISLAIYAIFFYFIFNQDLIYIAAVLVVLMIHEMGHFFAMKAFNYSNVKLFVLPMLGAYVTGKKSIISQRQMSMVILAGPLPGIVIGFCLLMSTIFYPNERLEMLGNIFFVLNLFNLLPFMPLSTKVAYAPPRTRTTSGCTDNRRSPYHPGLYLEKRSPCCIMRFSVGMRYLVRTPPF